MIDFYTQRNLPNHPFQIIRQMKGRWESNIMSGSDWCIPRNKTARPFYFQNKILMFCHPIPAAWCSQIGWPILGYINPLQIHECRNWEQGRAVLFLKIHKSDFRYSATDTNMAFYSQSFEKFSNCMKMNDCPLCPVVINWLFSLQFSKPNKCQAPASPLCYILFNSAQCIKHFGQQKIILNIIVYLISSAAL